MNQWLKGGSLLVVILAVAGWLWWLGGASEYSRANLVANSDLATATTSTPISTEPVVPPVVHLPTPEPLKALYFTQCAAASPVLREHILKLADETEINAIVADVKDYSGSVVFPSTTALAGGDGCRYPQFAELVKTWHEHNLYVIA